MVLWYLGVSTAFVWNVFRSPALDYRLVMAGSILPLVEVVGAGPMVLHSLVFAVGLLGLIVVATRGRRLLRRRLISLPIGLLTGLVLDGAWTSRSIFWWPFYGWAFPRDGLPELQWGLWVRLALELVGLVALGWCWRSFGFADPANRARFVRTGHLNRDLVR